MNPGSIWKHTRAPHCHSDLLGYLSPKRTPLGSGSPQGYIHAHQRTHTPHMPRKTSGPEAEPGLRSRLQVSSAASRGRGSRGQGAPCLLVGLTRGSCQPTGGSPAPPSAPGPPEASLLSSGPHTSTCHAAHPGQGGTVKTRA